MDKGQKLLELMAGANFRFHVDCSSPDRFLESGQRIDAEYAKIEALGEEHLNRIWCLTCLVLAEQLQPRALRKYGNTSDSSLRRVLADELLQPENVKWVEAARLAKEALRGQAFTDQQLEMIGQLFDSLPDVIINSIVEGVRQMCLIPLSEGPDIAGILSEMLKEAEGYANDIRNN
jgi:hypothetical protein